MGEKTKDTKGVEVVDKFDICDYYNEKREWPQEFDGFMLLNKQILPFDCPTCGRPLYNLSSVFLHKGSGIQLWCREHCYSTWPITVSAFLLLVPEAKKALDAAKAEESKKKALAEARAAQLMKNVVASKTVPQSSQPSQLPPPPARFEETDSQETAVGVA